MLSVAETQQAAQSLCLHIVICDLEICQTYVSVAVSPVAFPFGTLVESLTG